MSLVRWNPDYALSLYAEELARALTGAAEPQVWAPPVDVSETPTEYLIQAELPGVAPADVTITLQDHTLRITGERKAPGADKELSRWRSERPVGAFERCFCVPEDVDEGGTKADFKDGVLSLHLTKNPKAAPQVIEVHAA